MQDVIDKYFEQTLSQTPDLIYAEISEQRIKGRVHIALELVQSFIAAHGSNPEIALLEKTLIKDSGDQEKILRHWMLNNANANLYPKGVQSWREGLKAAVSLEKSLMVGITALMGDAINFACEISLLVRDDYAEYLVLRNILAAEADRLELAKYENHVAIDLVCERYDKSKDPGYEKLFALLKKANPWQVARILRPHKLTKNANLIHQLADEIIDQKIPLAAFTDMQKVNLLAMAYAVVGRDCYRALCDAFARQLGGQDVSSLTGWKRTWALASTAGGKAFSAETRAVSRSRKLNIAVCVSGQMRGFKDARATWALLGLDLHNTDYYVHTWKNIGVRFPHPDWKPHVERRFSDANFVDAYIRMCTKYGANAVAELYPSIFSTSSGDYVATESALRDAYGDNCTIVIDDEEDARFKEFSNQDKMYYKLAKCFELADEANKQYDLVIRIRPDLKVKDGTKVDWHNVFEESLNERVVFSEASAALKENLWVGDQFGAACYEVAKKYASTYNFHNAAQKTKISGVPAVRTGHSTLAWSLHCYGIRNEQLKQIKWGGLSDVQKLDNAQIKALIEKDIEGKGANVIHQQFLASLGA